MISMADDDETKWNHNEFCLSLAHHLLGSHKIHERLEQEILANNNSSVIRFYWKKSLTILQRDHQQEVIKQQQQDNYYTTGTRVWIDLTWTMEPQQDDIQVSVGQLVLIGHGENCAAKYYTSEPLTKSHIQRHFEALDIVFADTPTAVFAETLAKAFENFVEINNDKTVSNPTTLLELQYPDLQACASLYDWGLAQNQVSVLDKRTLQLLMLTNEENSRVGTFSVDKDESLQHRTVQDSFALYQEWRKCGRLKLSREASHETKERKEQDDVCKTAVAVTDLDTNVSTSSSNKNKRPNLNQTTAKPDARKIKRAGPYGFSRVPIQKKSGSKLKYKTST